MSAPFRNTRLKAIELAEREIPCFPCRLDNKAPCTKNGFKDAGKDPDQVRKLFERHRGALVGVPTGVYSGFDALDLDSKHPEAHTWWKENRHRMPPTRVHRTRSRGLHLLFQHR